MISRRRFDGVFCQGTRRTVRSASPRAGFVAWWRPVCSSARPSLFWRLELGRQLVRLDFDSDDDMGADEVAIISWRGILEMLADGTSDAPDLVKAAIEGRLPRGIGVA